MRIKLPGSPKIKALILAILVIVSVAIIGKTAIDNKNAAELKAQLEQEERERIEREEEEARIAEEERQKKQREEELYNNAYSLFHNRQYDEAIKAADNLINEFSDSYKGYTIKGISEGYAGNFTSGMNDIDKALQIKSDYGYGRFNKALLYELNEKFDEALEWYDKALEVEKYMWSYYGKASIYGRKGAVDDAVINLNLALSAAPTDADKNSIKENARSEQDFDPINGDKKFQDVIK